MYLIFSSQCVLSFLTWLSHYAIVEYLFRQNKEHIFVGFMYLWDFNDSKVLVIIRLLSMFFFLFASYASLF